MNTKKLLIAAASVGLIAIPSFVVARNSTDDTNRQSDGRQEDRQNEQQEDRRQDRQNNDQNEQRAITKNGIIKIENETSLPAGSTTIDQAMGVAQAAFPNKTIRKIEVETEDGAVVISVRFTDNSRVDVRASDGQITRQQDRFNTNNVQNNQNQSASNSRRHGSSSQPDDDDDGGDDGGDNGGDNDRSGSGHGDSNDD